MTLRLTNRRDAPRTIVLEPWTGEYTLQPNQSFDIVAEGDTKYPLHIELSDDSVIVSCFDSAGAQVRIFKDGVELKQSE